MSLLQTLLLGLLQQAAAQDAEHADQLDQANNDEQLTDAVLGQLLGQGKQKEQSDQKQLIQEMDDADKEQ